MMKTIGSPIVGSKILREKNESLRNIIFYHTYVIIMLSGRLGPLKLKNPILDRILADFRTWMVLLTLGTIVVVYLFVNTGTILYKIPKIDLRN